MTPLLAARCGFCGGLGLMAVVQEQLEIALPIFAAVDQREPVIAIDLVSVEIHHLAAAAGADAFLFGTEA